MRRFLKVAVPLLLAALIVLSIGWYFFQYDSTFTRNLLLQQARKQEVEGNHDLAVWMYNLAYKHSSENDDVAIELAQQFKAIGNYTKAEFTLSKAIEDGGSVELYIALCQTYVEQDKLRDAVIMLDSVTDPAIKAQLDQLRPAAPVCDADSGTYMQYITVSASAEGTLYLTTKEDYPSIHTDAYTGPITLPAGQTTLFAVCIGENGLVSPLAVYHYVVGNVVEEVAFSDAAFEAAVRARLGVDEAYVIHSNQLWEFSEFTVPAEATDCSDLKWMPYLETLTLDGAGFDSLDCLSGLTGLRSLTVRNATVSTADLKRIAQLPLLEQLTLSNCGISNITALSQCAGLTHLDLSNNAIRDITPLASLTALKSLDLQSNAVIQADAICSLPALQELNLANNSLTTTAPLGALTALTHLDVSANDLMKLEGLETLENLLVFSAADNNLIDVNILSGCTKLQTLNVSGNTLLNIDVAAQLLQLQELDFSHNEVSSLPAFSADCALRIINGSYNALASLTRLSGLKNLEYIYMNYADRYNSKNSLTNIDALAICPALKEVHVYGTKVRNVTKLSDKGIFVQFTPV